MRDIDLSNVKEASYDSQKLPQGGYICKILKVEDFSDKEYLKITFDIVEGEYKGHYRTLYDKYQFWGGEFIRSYKVTALSFFKSFTTAIENSNKGYKFECKNEQALKGKLVGLVFREEEYLNKNSEMKIRLSLAETRSIETIKSGEYNSYELKKYTPGKGQQLSANSELPELTDEDLPF